MSRARKIADGGTAPHVDTCTCGARVIRHRSARGPVVLDFEPEEGAPFIIFGGHAYSNFAECNVPRDQLRYREHACPLVVEGVTS